jgi:putative hydrolase of the HAD superfamily
MDKAIKYMLFDAANTLIYKPELWVKFNDVLLNYGYKVNSEELKHKHKLLSEVVKFPDVTSQSFYNTFNKELLNALGIIDSPELLEALFTACKYLPWEVFPDTTHLKNYTDTPLGVISNFNSGLSVLLQNKLPEVNFKDIIISETEGISKPSLEFYKIAIERTGLKPSEILYIGDSLKLDIIPAKSLGFQVKLIDRDFAYPASPYRISSIKDLF